MQTKEQRSQVRKGPWTGLKTDLKAAQDEAKAAHKEASHWAGRAEQSDWHNMMLAVALHNAENENRLLQEGLKEALAFIGAQTIMEASHGRFPATKP